MWHKCACGYEFGATAARVDGSAAEAPSEGDLWRAKNKYRTFWPRFWAGIYDAFVFLPLGFVDGIVTSTVHNRAILIAWASSPILPG